SPNLGPELAGIVLEDADVEHQIGRILFGRAAEDYRPRAEHAFVPRRDLDRRGTPLGAVVVRDRESVFAQPKVVRIAGRVVVLRPESDDIVDVEVAAVSRRICEENVRAGRL